MKNKERFLLVDEYFNENSLSTWLEKYALKKDCLMIIDYLMDTYSDWEDYVIPRSKYQMSLDISELDEEELYDSIISGIYSHIAGSIKINHKTKLENLFLRLSIEEQNCLRDIGKIINVLQGGESTICTDEIQDKFELMDQLFNNCDLSVLKKACRVFFNNEDVKANIAVGNISVKAPDAKEPKKKKSNTKTTAPVKHHDISILNTEVDFEKTILPDCQEYMNFLKETKEEDMHFKSYNLLFTGAPGTGKTQAAKWLAQQLGVPLIEKRFSELGSMWISETEKNISAAFQEAKESNAILFVDELDGIISDRRNSSNSWEVTQINEFLVQMEDFAGIFIGATNFDENLDQALSRRFVHNIEFKALNADGLEILYNKMFSSIVGTPLTKLETKNLRKLSNVTPGNLKQVLQQNFFRRNKTTHVDLINALEKTTMKCDSKSIKL